jgi:hypothetical protein
MKGFIILSAIALLSLSSCNNTQEAEVKVTKSLKILNIHDTVAAKILLA